MLRDKAKECIDSELQYGSSYNAYHYNCAEAMLNAANDYYDLNLNKQTLNMITPFGSGMYVRDACGMLTGGVAVLGVMFAEDKPSFNPKLEEMTRLWVKRFNEEFKDTNCELLKDANEVPPNTPCTDLILEACDILEGIIEKYKNKIND